jgi:hypothetical protein
MVLNCDNSIDESCCVDGGIPERPRRTQSSAEAAPGKEQSFAAAARRRDSISLLEGRRLNQYDATSTESEPRPCEDLSPPSLAHGETC